MSEVHAFLAINGALLLGFGLGAHAMGFRLKRAADSCINCQRDAQFCWPCCDRIAGIEPPTGVEVGRALEGVASMRLFINSRERIKQPDGAEWFEQQLSILRRALAPTIKAGGTD